MVARHALTFGLLRPFNFPQPWSRGEVRLKFLYNGMIFRLSGKSFWQFHFIIQLGFGRSSHFYRQLLYVDMHLDSHLNNNDGLPGEGRFVSLVETER